MAPKKTLSVFFCNINSRLCWKYYTFINCIHMAILFLLWTCAARPFPIVPTTVFPRVSILPSSDYLTRINFLNLIIAIFNSLLNGHPVSNFTHPLHINISLFLPKTNFPFVSILPESNKREQSFELHFEFQTWESLSFQKPN